MDLDAVAQATVVVVVDFDTLPSMLVEIVGNNVRTNCDEKED